MAKKIIAKTKATRKSSKIYIIDDKNDVRIKAIKAKGQTTEKKRLFLDVDGTLVAMQYNPNFRNAKEWLSVHRTDFCHWINSIHVVLDELCEVYVLTNYTLDAEKKAKEDWLRDNLKCKHITILNKEGITKSLYVNGKKDILVDDTLRNLDEWYRVGGTFFAYQYVTCEKGRRELLEKIIKK